MRIAYVSNDLGVPVCGRKGCSIHVQEVVRALARRGARVELFSTNCDGALPEGFEQVSLHSLPRPATTDGALREAACVALNSDWIAALEREGPFDLVYERYSLWSFAGMEFARARGIPGVLEVNSPLIDEQATYRVLRDRAAAERVARQVVAAAGVVLAVSDGVAAYLHGFAEAQDKVHVLPNGVDPTRFCVRVKPGSKTELGSFTIGFVGGLKPWHGLSVLVNAFALFCREAPESRLLIVGDGPERDNLLKQLAELNLAPKADLTGAVPHSKVPDLLASMDVAVAPYPELAGFYFSPLKVYEYMAAGLPVVASNIGQLTQLIRPGVDGLLVPPGDPGALARALLSLAREPLLRQQLGQAARARILQEHTWEKVVDRVLALVARAIA